MWSGDAPNKRPFDTRASPLSEKLCASETAQPQRSVLALLVPMSVMHVRAVFVVMFDRFVLMQVRVLPDEITMMIVVAVIVAMSVLMLNDRVNVSMGVLFGQMQEDANCKQTSRSSGQPS